MQGQKFHLPAEKVRHPLAIIERPFREIPGFFNGADCWVQARHGVKKEQAEHARGFDGSLLRHFSNVFGKFAKSNGSDIALVGVLRPPFLNEVTQLLLLFGLEEGHDQRPRIRLQLTAGLQQRDRRLSELLAYEVIFRHHPGHTGEHHEIQGVDQRIRASGVNDRCGPRAQLDSGGYLASLERSHFRGKFIDGLRHHRGEFIREAHDIALKGCGREHPPAVGRLQY